MRELSKMIILLIIMIISKSRRATNTVIWFAKKLIKSDCNQAEIEYEDGHIEKIEILTD